MTEERVAPWIVRQIEGNLWAIFASVFAAFSAYLIGTTTTDHRLTELEGDVAEVKTELKALSPRVERLDATTGMLVENAREDRKAEK